jgi:hypothetical protein
MCNEDAGICQPWRDADASGFKVCIYHDDDVDCPTDPPANQYSEKHVFYSDPVDTRGCAPCACDAPAGSACSTQVSVYSNATCTAPIDLATVTSAGPVCHDLPTGVALGGKTAAPPTYTPGTCQPSGGEPTGAFMPKLTSTLCCLPP